MSGEILQSTCDIELNPRMMPADTEREQELSFAQKISSVNAAYVTCCLSFRAQDG